jgi:hypothetical protein
MMPYISEEGENMDVTCCYCEDVTGEVNVNNGIVIISNSGDYVVQNNLNECDVCAFQFGVKEGCLNLVCEVISIRVVTNYICRR